MWVEILLFLFLAVCAVFDGLRKQIPLAVVWLGMLTAICLRLTGIMGEEGVTAALLSLIPGAGFFLLSFLTREKVGYGDGWVLLMIGLFSGFSRCFLILLIGLLLESMVAVVLLLLKKVKRDKEIPFSPFLLLGMGVTLCF
ncbi:MAG: prepilin peptidase [Lachnospiraceae bacterium]|nr:prepilin peptidase [Lachnospiraceae bacterium]